jgi:SAM-dependent methyltransferase
MANLEQVLIYIRPKGKAAFLHKLKQGASVLDVGSGRNSAYRFKSILPSLHYTGIDIVDYDQSLHNLADEYVRTTPEEFWQAIDKFTGKFDAVVSSHNIEHCNDRENTLRAMAKAIKPGGKLYLSFPSEKSVNFPSRKGTLNYYDDPTHTETPPNLEWVVDILEQSGCKILFSTPSYKPFLNRMIGMFNEPISRLRKKVMQGTWPLYGFESVIWAEKI